MPTAVQHVRLAGIDSSADFFRRERFASFARFSGQRREPRELSQMTAFGPFVTRLSVVTAYVALAFVGAIILGVF
jgi:hypothetical protein